MKNVAKGDVAKLCEHTRELTYELNAAGETTNDLLANLIEALKKASDSNFQRWLGNHVDLWSMRKIDWKEDGSDLMDDVEIYYQEANNTHKWGKKAYRKEVQYAFKAVDSGTETEVEKDKPKEESYEETIKALTAQLQEYATAYTARWSESNQKPNLDSKYAWKHISPKAGEPVIKKMHVDGQSKTYYWRPHHLQWTIHKSSECKRLKPSRGKKGSKEKKVFKRQKASIHSSKGSISSMHEWQF
jgi:hypothetical protein